MNIKKKSLFKKMLIFSSLILLLISVFVGNFFVNYALMPGKGGENRKIKKADTKQKEEKFAKEKDVINKNKGIFNENRDKWLLEKKANTKELEIKSKDGLILKGHEILQKDKSDKWIVLVHGYQSSEKNALVHGPAFFKQGFNILSLSLRAHKPSEGKYIGMGYLDKDDLLLWAQDLSNRYPQAKIYFHGTSMGGSSVLMMSSLKGLPANVKGIIDDCGYSDVWKIFSLELKKRFSLPSFPVMDLSSFFSKIRAGYNLGEIKVKEYVEKLDLPILFIHGSNDDFVPMYMTEEMYAAKTKGKKDIFIVEGAGHAQAHLLSPKEYYSRIFTFIKNIK